MTTYPDIPFVDGQIYTPDIAYLAFHQSYGDSLDLELLGNHPGITDEQLSNVPTAIKTRVSNVLDPLQVKAVAGLTISYNSGIVALTDGSLVTIPAAQVVVGDNTTLYVYVDGVGAVIVATTLPVICRPLAKVVTSGGAITSITDLRALSIRQVAPRPASIKSFGGVSTSDIICTALTNLNDGLFYCRDFIVPSGVSVTVPGWLKIYASRNVVINGSLIINPISEGGDASVLIPSTTAGFRGLNKGNGLGNVGSVYGWGFQGYGSGGYSGYGITSNAITYILTPVGGKGGGGVVIEAGGTITGTGTISAKGSDGTGGYSYLNATPTNTTPGYFEPTTSASIIGSAGGSGGFVSLSALGGVVFSGTIDVRGGNGGLSMTNIATHFAGGGCPGAGGVVVITSPTYNISGATLQLTGGSFGTSQQLVTGATVSSGVWTLPVANTTSNSSGQRGASFGVSGGYWNTATVGSNYILTPVASQTGLIVLRDYVPLG